MGAWDKTKAAGALLASASWTGIKKLVTNYPQLAPVLLFVIFILVYGFGKDWSFSKSDTEDIGASVLFFFPPMLLLWRSASAPRSLFAKHLWVAGWIGVVLMAFGAVAWFGELGRFRDKGTKRYPFEAAFVEVFPPQPSSKTIKLGGLVRDNVPANADQIAKNQHQMDIWKEWVHKGNLKENDPTRLLVVRAKEDFKKKYDTFRVKVTFGNDQAVQLLEGVAFLENPQQPGKVVSYRQVVFSVTKGSPTNDNFIELVQPEIGETLVVLVKLTARPDHTLPVNMEGYGIQLPKI
jgi:hypothetical protein